MRALLALALLILSGCVAPADDGTDQQLDAPAGIPDPLVPGNRTVTQHEYDFGYLVGEDPELFPYRYPVPIHGALWLPDGTDPVPLVMLMHGRHGTCAVLGIEGIGTGACPNAGVVTPVTSYLGYTGLAENLASHGYAVASIDANTINDRDLLGDAGANARGQLVHRTLDHFESVNATGRSLPDAPGAPTALPRREVPSATFAAPQGWDHLSLRVGGTSDPIRLWLEVAGTPSPDAALPTRPGKDNAKTVLSEVRFALDGAGGDLVVHCSGAGKIQVADVMLV